MVIVMTLLSLYRFSFPFIFLLQGTNELISPSLAVRRQESELPEGCTILSDSGELEGPFRPAFLKADEGNISSPVGEDGNYISNLYCEWKILVSPGMVSKYSYYDFFNSHIRVSQSLKSCKENISAQI